jgi:tetratricopeptide (TPR) repeat protein
MLQHSLQLAKRIYNVRGEAMALHQMANIYASQGRVEKALNLYQQSLKIKEYIGDADGTAATLHQMAVIPLLSLWVSANAETLIGQDFSQ